MDALDPDFLEELLARIAAEADVEAARRKAEEEAEEARRKAEKGAKRREALRQEMARQMGGRWAVEETDVE